MFILGLILVCLVGTIAVVSIANRFPLTIGDSNDNKW